MVSEQNFSESEIYLKLKEAEYQAISVKKRYTNDEVMTELRKTISGKKTRQENLEPFDYTEWQRGLFNDMSVKELSNTAMKEYKNN